jgi:hypothetical protein
MGLDIGMIEIPKTANYTIKREELDGVILVQSGSAANDPPKPPEKTSTIKNQNRVASREK